MRKCKTCRRYLSCLEGDREYPCRDWERRKRNAGRIHTGDQDDIGKKREKGLHRAAGTGGEEEED